jgi:hypothetical protein
VSVGWVWLFLKFGLVHGARPAIYSRMSWRIHARLPQKDPGIASAESGPIERDVQRTARLECTEGGRAPVFPRGGQNLDPFHVPPKKTAGSHSTLSTSDSGVNNLSFVV